jgi:eukaryotic-like serine/threonine-protein kinase
VAGPDTFREPLDAALREQLERFERITLSGLQLICAVGLVMGVVIAATVSPNLGVACAMAGAGLLAWFVFYRRLLMRGAVSERLRTIATVIESTTPWIVLFIIAMRQGALYAIASWVPPMFFAALMVAYTARLQPKACLILGVVSAIAYPATYAFVLHAKLVDVDLLVAKPAMQISRGFSVLLGGIACAYVTRGVRSAIARAESVVREQDLFGKYRLMRRIASGGMGMVLEALYCPEGGFERRVAIKRIHPHLAADPRFVNAFRTEAELSARLGHPNIVQVMDFGRVADSYFLAMEYVDGLTLSALTSYMAKSGKRYAAPVVGYILREILGALQYAHEGARDANGAPLRVVHRDLCPPNVLLSRNGQVKLTDFGIARSLKDVGMSMTQHIEGHVGYMAPEQARAESFDTRTDLFPVGVIAWEMLAMKPLFKRGNETESLVALLHGDVPPIDELRADIDPAWSRFIARALAREASARYAAASEMLTALDAIPDARGMRAAEDLARLVDQARNVTAPGDEAATLVDSHPRDGASA